MKKFFLYRALIKRRLANFVVLSTLHDEVKVTKGERRKPDIHKLYDHTKGGGDEVDLISTSCTTRIKNKRLAMFQQMPKLFFKNLPQNSKCQTLNLHMHLVNCWCCPRLKGDMLTQTESKLI